MRYRPTHIYILVQRAVFVILWTAALNLFVSMRATAREFCFEGLDDSLSVSKRERRMERREQVRAKIDSAVAAKYYKINYDTLYIMRPEETWLVKARVNVSGSFVIVKQHSDSNEGRGRLRSNYKTTLSVGVSYRGLTAGLAFNPDMLRGRKRDFEFNLNSYSNRYGLDLMFLASKTMSGNTYFGNEKVFVGEGDMQMNLLNVNGYYAFNSKRFSYPAAFSQSYVQKRSAGSWLAGFSYMGGSVKTTDSKPDGMPDTRIYLGHFALGGGYGYNWIINKRMLVHASALPTLVVLNRNNIKLNGEKEDMAPEFPDVILTERVAVVYALNKKSFGGGTFVMTNSLLGGGHLDIDYSKWRTRVFWGMRF